MDPVCKMRGRRALSARPAEPFQRFYPVRPRRIAAERSGKDIRHGIVFEYEIAPMAATWHGLPQVDKSSKVEGSKSREMRNFILPGAFSRPCTQRTQQTHTHTHMYIRQSIPHHLVSGDLAHTLLQRPGCRSAALRFFASSTNQLRQRY